ncbi:MAG: RdgB/HAM1 family non-canonical purine NTP pyrophosphatase [Planctomycetes bacterium]|nr:RdgB/HAM1 family non-canonical purine NTP pyrophosphatase [Planctomycetota bacterium]
MIELLLATRNSSKREEMRALLEGLDGPPVRILTLDDFPRAPEVLEDGSTLQENAAKKARQTAEACGALSVADDSGLFVDALDGRPGINSARYAGQNPTSEKLCRKLLREMEGIAPARRGAHFRCCIAMADPGGRVVLTAEGRVDGLIIGQMRGTGGFGYDPVFYYEPQGKTFAQMTPGQKHAVSHRGRALRRFRREWVRLAGSA